MGLKSIQLALCPLLFASCLLPPDKPVVELPAITSDFRAEEIGRLASIGDVSSLGLVGTTLVAGTDKGLFLIDIEAPEAPRIVGSIEERRVDALAVLGSEVYVTQISGDRQLRVIDVSNPNAPRELKKTTSPTLTFGGIAARPGLLWHAVGSNPPSKLFYDLEELKACDAPSRERGAMNVWLEGDLAFESIHFDDYAGDGFDGNGAYGMAILRSSTPAGECPAFRLRNIVYFDTHARNRSAFERRANSDLQAAYAPQSRQLALSGEQQLRLLLLDQDDQTSEQGTLPIPEAIDVALIAEEDGLLLGVANGDFQLADAREGSLHYGGQSDVEGVARVVTALPEFRSFAVGSSEGLTIIRARGFE